MELTTFDAVYAWEQITATPAFRRYTLFDSDIDGEQFGTLIRHFKEVLAQIRPSVAFVPGWGTRGALVAHLSSVAAGIPIIVMSDSTAHDAQRLWWKEAIKRRIVGLYSASLVAGRPHVEYLVNLGMARERIFTGYDVVDNVYFATGAEQARHRASHLRGVLNLPEQYFLASGRFIKEKNFSSLLRAYARYRKIAGREAWKLVLLGDGPLKPELTRLIDELSLNKDVLLPGFKQYEELPAYYGLGGTFVHSSKTEPWGLVVNEAMASGLPVIVSERCGCTSDLVESGSNGFTFNPYDVDELASLMVKVASDDCDREAMGQASREIISSWTPELFAENLLRATEVAMNAARRPARPWDRALLTALAYR